MRLSSWQNMLNMCFMFKILVMKGGQWFYTEKQLVLMLKMMIQLLILVSVLSPHKMQPNINGDEEFDDVLANRNDHDEGELINII